MIVDASITVSPPISKGRSYPCSGGSEEREGKSKSVKEKQE
ncbi:MAG: hypothetical protein ACMUEL_04640 [Flavobacteriales bacterium Tduv]